MQPCSCHSNSDVLGENSPNNQEITVTAFFLIFLCSREGPDDAGVLRPRRRHRRVRGALRAAAEVPGAAQARVQRRHPGQGDGALGQERHHQMQPGEEPEPQDIAM